MCVELELKFVPYSDERPVYSVTPCLFQKRGGHCPYIIPSVKEFIITCNICNYASNH